MIYTQILWVTLESDYATYQALSILPKDKAKQIPIIPGSSDRPRNLWAIF